MTIRYVSALLIGVAFVSLLAGRADAQAEAGANDSSVILSQQVWALQTMHDLELDAAQLDALRAAIPKLEEDNSQRVVQNVSAKYLSVLNSLRGALLEDSETKDSKDQIDTLRDELESIREDEQVRLDDHVLVSDAATAVVPAIMKIIRPGQLAAYLAAYQDEVPEPAQVLARAANESRGLDDAKFGAQADRTSHDVAALIAGLDKEKSAGIVERARHWLEHQRELSDDDFKTAKAGLEKSAADAIGPFDSFDVLRHFVERDVAELLSNPRLSSMIDERVKKLTK